MDSENFHLPEFTPTRDQILQYGILPPVIDASYNPKKRLDKRILQEAERRFLATLRISNPLPIIASDQPPKYSEPPNYMNIEERDDWEANYEARHEDWQDTLQQLELELEDPYTQQYLRQLVALRISANKLRDKYYVEKKTFQSTQDDPILQSIEAKYQLLADEILSTTRSGYQQKEYTPYPYIDEDDKEQVEYIYKSDPYINELNPENYQKLARIIADKCANNSYLESLFEIFAPISVRQQLETTYSAAMAKKSKNETSIEISPEIKAIIQHAREYIGEIYRLTEQQIPIITFVRNKEELDEIISVSQRNRRMQKDGLFNQLTQPLPKTSQTGIYITGDRDTQSKITAYSIWDTSVPPIDNTVVVFEEIYHASGEIFKDQSSNGQKWPGWNVLDETGDLLEEGLAGYETNEFFKTHYKDMYLAPGTRANHLLRYTRGEEVVEDIMDIWPTVLVTQLIDRIGPQLLVKFRRARMNKPGSVTNLEKDIDKVLGNGTYSQLAYMKGHHNGNQIHEFIKRKGLNQNVFPN